MTSRGAVPGSTAVKQEGNISGEVSQGPGKGEKQHTGRLFPSMQHRAEKRGLQNDVPESPPSHRYHTVQDVLYYDSHQLGHVGVAWVI